MKVKITCTTERYEAGLVYDVTDEKAQQLIQEDKAILAEDEVIEEKPKRKVKHGDW